MKNKDDRATPMLKLSVIDSSGTHGTLTIWRPNDDLFHGLREKGVVKVNNAMVVSIRDGIVNLKCTKQTRFNQIDNNFTDITVGYERYILILNKYLCMSNI